jgi:hypothetical protein
MPPSAPLHRKGSGMTNSKQSPDANDNFVFPEGTEFWVGVNDEGEFRAYAIAPTPSGGFTSLRPDGTKWPPGWRYGGDRVSREEWDKYVAESTAKRRI